MFDQVKFTRSQLLADEIRAFLRSEPIPGHSTQFDFEGHAATSGKHGEKYRNSVNNAITRCGQLMARLKPLTGTFPDGPALMQQLLERRNGLTREFERFASSLLSSIEKEIFAGDPTVLQTSDRFGKKSQPPRRPPERLPKY